MKADTEVDVSSKQGEAAYVLHKLNTVSLQLKIQLYPPGGGGGGVLDISLGGEVRHRPSYPDPV